jgi:DNA-binding CsgD family transcriptional regulator
VDKVTGERIARLSERQKACLRRVAAGQEIKEIARDLDTTPAAIVERLRAARRTLDVGTSREAARMLAEHEAKNPQESAHSLHRETGVEAYMRDVDMLRPVAPAGTGLSSDGSSSEDASQSEWRVEDASVAFQVTPIVSPPAPFPWPVRTRRRPVNDLTIAERLLASGALSLGMVVATSVIIIAVVLLMEFLIHVSRHGA